MAEAYTRLDADQRLPAAAGEAFARDGVIVIEDFVAAEQCDRLRARALSGDERGGDRRYAALCHFVVGRR